MLSALDLLERLVGFPTVVGVPNGALMDFIRDYLGGYGLSCHVLPGPEGDRFNLFATIGDPSLPGYV
ncbi:acetylornithine deacetylase, partial [Thioclava sp. BHET1]